MSAALRPEVLDVLRRHVQGTRGLAEHQAKYQEWWAIDGVPEDSEGPLAEATKAWRDLLVMTPAQQEVLDVIDELVALADERCLIHEDCLSSGALARECARTAGLASTDKGGGA